MKDITIKQLIFFCFVLFFDIGVFFKVVRHTNEFDLHFLSFIPFLVTKCPKHTDITIQGVSFYLIFKYTQISVIYIINRPLLQGINILYFKNVIFHAKIFWCRRILFFKN